jgi:hypothetical protein
VFCKDECSKLGSGDVEMYKRRAIHIACTKVATSYAIRASYKNMTRRLHDPHHH